MKISICIPVYNGSKTIYTLIKRLNECFQSYDFEIVLVNDGSKDNSSEVCRQISEEYSFVKFIDLRRNYGEHNAVMCALNYCTGDYAAIIDDDLQNPPEEILKLIEESEKGFDVVYAKYHKKKHSWFRNLGSKVNDIFATWLLEKPKNLYLCSFKVIRRAIIDEIIDEIIKYKGPFPYIDGLILRVTNNISSVYVVHEDRKEGKSNYTFSKLLNLYLSMFVNFSIKPMRLMIMIGFIILILALFAGVCAITERLLHPEITQGWASLIVVILFFGGLHSVFTGLIGEYIGKNYLDENGTPQYCVKQEFLNSERLTKNERKI